MKRVLVQDELALRQMTAYVRGLEKYSFDTETTGLSPWKNEIFLFTLSDGETAWAVPVKNFSRDLIIWFLECIFENPQGIVFGHNIKFDRNFVKCNYGVEIKRQVHDTILMAALLDENRYNGLKPLMESVLEVSTTSEKAVLEWLSNNFETKAQYDYSKVPDEIMLEYAADDAYYCYKLYENLWPQIQDAFPTTYEIDRKVSNVLYKMEQEGVPVSLSYLADLEKRYTESRAAWAQKVFEALGYEFNLGSPIELAEVLYGSARLNLPCPKFTQKGQQSTDDDALAQLDHPVVELIREWQNCDSLLTNAVIPYQESADILGNVHGQYAVTRTKTGRLSCERPNLQNPPKDPVFREAFISKSGWDMFFFDQSQIELVGLVVYSKEPSMMAILQAGGDLHTLTASKIFGVEMAQIEPWQRAVGKAINFAIVFGVGKAKLAGYINQYLPKGTPKLTLEQAAEFKAKYFEQFPQVPIFQRKVINTVRTWRPPYGHYVKNTFGRVRRIQPDKAYTGINHLVQGWAAYLMKTSMIRIDEEFGHEPWFKWRQNIHDAIRVDLRKDLTPTKRKKVIERIGHHLTYFPEVPVPIKLTVDTSSTNWAEVKKWVA